MAGKVWNDTRLQLDMLVAGRPAKSAAAPIASSRNTGGEHDAAKDRAAGRRQATARARDFRRRFAIHRRLGAW